MVSMARKKQRLGPCHLCGEVGPLTFEHVPPRAAFNDRPVIRADYEKLLNSRPGAKVRGPVQQLGAGAYTLCARCNNTTGALYAPAFIKWCGEGMRILSRAPNRQPALSYPIWASQLETIKQIVTMFFSVNAPTFQEANPELVRFVMNPRLRGLSPRYRIFTYFTATSDLRFLGLSVAGDHIRMTMRVMSEIAFPPFGYLMTFDSAPPDSRLAEITHFAWGMPRTLTQMMLHARALHTASHLPGDYRTAEQVNAAFDQNEADRQRKELGQPSRAPIGPDEGEQLVRMMTQMHAAQSALTRIRGR